MTGPTSLVTSAVDGGAFASATLPGMIWLGSLWPVARPTSRPLPRPKALPAARAGATIRAISLVTCDSGAEEKVAPEKAASVFSSRWPVTCSTPVWMTLAVP